MTVRPWIDVVTEEFDHGYRVALTNIIDGSSWVEWTGDEPNDAMVTEMIERWAESLMVVSDQERAELSVAAIGHLGDAA